MDGRRTAAGRSRGRGSAPRGMPRVPGSSGFIPQGQRSFRSPCSGDRRPAGPLQRAVRCACGHRRRCASRVCLAEASPNYSGGRKHSATRRRSAGSDSRSSKSRTPARSPSRPKTGRSVDSRGANHSSFDSSRCTLPARCASGRCRPGRGFPPRRRWFPQHAALSPE